MWLWITENLFSFNFYLLRVNKNLKISTKKLVVGRDHCRLVVESQRDTHLAGDIVTYLLEKKKSAMKRTIP